MQHPMMFVLDGGNAIPQDRQDSEIAAAWTVLAGATEVALSELHPQHPQRHEILAMRSAFREAARLPAQPSLSRVV